MVTGKRPLVSSLRSQVSHVTARAARDKMAADSERQEDFPFVIFHWKAKAPTRQGATRTPSREDAEAQRNTKQLSERFACQIPFAALRLRVSVLNLVPRLNAVDDK